MNHSYFNTMLKLQGDISQALEKRFRKLQEYS